MMKSSPAFQFYPDDFLGGVITMNLQQRGLYITLLCVQWNQGFVTKDDFESLTDGIAMAEPMAKRVFAKFDQCQDGQFRNARLEEVRQKQAEYSANRSESGKAGANKRWHSHSAAIAQPMANDSSPSPSPTPIAEREQNFPEIPSIELVLAESQRIGLAEWKARDWFEEMEGCGWLDHQKRRIYRWQSVLARVKTKWEADGRPAGPPSAASKTKPVFKTYAEREAEAQKEKYKARILREIDAI